MNPVAVTPVTQQAAAALVAACDAGAVSPPLSQAEGVALAIARDIVGRFEVLSDRRTPRFLAEGCRVGAFSAFAAAFVRDAGGQG